MKKILFLILVLLSVNTFATRWHVKADGSNAAAGTKIAPLQTLAHAFSTAALNYDTVVLIGTVNITTTVFPEIHTSLISDIDNPGTIIYTGNSIALAWYSATIQSGGFTVDGITFDGQNTGTGAVTITRLGNVTFKNCTIKDFIDGGLNFYNPATTAPAVTGNIIYNNTITNCTQYLAAGSFGNLWLTGQKNALVRKNTITATFRTGDNAGFVFKSSHSENFKIDSNTFTVIGHDDGAKWCFAMEMNHNFGGHEINANRIQGVIDFAGTNCLKGNYNYSVWIHHNNIGHTTQSARYQYGIFLEISDGLMEQVIIEDNTFDNLTAVLQFYSAGSEVTRKIYFRRNLCTNIGIISGSGLGWGVMQSGSSTTATLRDVYLDNNTFSALSTGSQIAAIRLPYRIATRNYNARNNIIIGFENSPIITDGGVLTGTIDTLNIQNNLIYNNGNSNNVNWYGIQPTNVTNTGVVKSDPLFISATNYKLQPTSPAINTGLKIGYPYSGTAPDIGYSEYDGTKKIQLTGGKIKVINGKIQTR